MADAAGYARPSLTLAQQGRRRLPPEVLTRFGELLHFGPEGFTSLRIEPALVRDEEHLQALAEAGFTTKPLLQILSDTEARILEDQGKLPPNESGELPARVGAAAPIPQQFVVVRVGYASTHRFLVLRGSPPRLAAMLADHRGRLPHLRLPAGLHRHLPELEAAVDTEACPHSARAFVHGLTALERGRPLPGLFLENALVDWIREKSRKPRGAELVRPSVQVAVRESISRRYALTAAGAQRDEFFGRLRSGIPTLVRVLISASERIEVAALSTEQSHLIVVHIVDGPVPLSELVFEGPAAVALPKGSGAQFLDLDDLRAKNALVRSTSRLTRKQ